MTIPRAARTGAGILAATAASLASIQSADAATHTAPAAPTVHLSLFAAAPWGATHPDDITLLGDDLYVAYQNNAAADGTPVGSTSTVVAFERGSGHVEATYTVTGRVDGLTADVRHDRILATSNEDNNSSLFVITPNSHQPLSHYIYSPNPAQTGSDGTNGGTDAVSVSSNGTIYVAHSNPDPALPAPNNPAAVYKMTLSGTTAHLTPFFGVNDTAKVVNPAAGWPTSAPLGLTDPDSNRYLPGRDGGTLIQVAQADSKMVFATDLDSKTPHLTQLNLTNATGDPATTPQLDDVERAGGAGTLYVVDQKTGNIYKVDTEDVAAGTLFATQPAPKAGDLPNTPALAVVNQWTGVVTQVATDVVLGSPKGLLFVPSDSDHHDR
jgi:hypothetical protein